LPFIITAPGTYVLTGNLHYTGTDSARTAISISGAIAGPVVLDLKGFTITGVPSPDFGADCISIFGSNTGLYPITIRNGTITKFETGVDANLSRVTTVSNVTINNVIFDQNAEGVSFTFVDSSTIKNCTFKNMSPYGIFDYQSTGGNSYNSDIFVGSGNALYVQGQFQGNGGTPLVLDRCDFAAPPSN
jgi:Right handed beta helix region